MATQPDYSFKGGLSGDAIIQAIQRKSQMEEQQRMNNAELQGQKHQQWMQTAQLASEVTGNLIAHSKAKQKQDFINTLADSLASQGSLSPNTGNATLFNAQGGVTSVPTASYNPEQGDLLRNATLVNPEEASEAVFKAAMPQTQPNLGRQKSTTNYTDPDGNLIRVISDTVSGKSIALTGPLAGQEVPTDYMATLKPGFAPRLLKDPNTGNVSQVSSNAVTTPLTGPAPVKKGEKITDYNQLTPVQRTIVDKEVSLSQADPVIGRINERVAKFEEAEELLNTPNWVTDATLGAILARTVASEVGNLNETEQKRYNITPEVWRGVKTRVSRWAQGQRTEEDREDIALVLTTLKQKAIDNRERRLDVYANRLSNKIPKADKKVFKEKFLSQSEGTSAQPKKFAVDQDALDAELKRRGL